MKLEQVLADWRERAQILRASGYVAHADSLTAFADDVAAATEDYRTFVNETDARLISGKSVEWLRGRFGEWLALDNARLVGRKREYRMIVLPRRADLAAARAAGQRAARGEAA